MKLTVINHHGRTPAGSEFTLLRYLKNLPKHINISFILFEDGAFAELLRKDGFAITILPMSKKMTETTRSSLNIGVAIKALHFIFQLRSVLWQDRPDLVLTNSVKAHYIGAPAAALAGIPSITYLHDVLTGPALWTLRIISRWCAQSRLACSRLAARSLQLPATWVTYSPITMREFADLPDRIRARTALGLPTDRRRVIGLVGRIAPWKGQDRFLRIAAEVLASYDVHVAIVGSATFGCEESYPPSLHRLAASLGIADRVFFIPWQSDMRVVYAALDLVCNCSTREPFGRTILEALASGIPVVCFEDAGVCELFSHSIAAQSVKVNDHQAFSQAILRLLNSLDEGISFVEPARMIAQQADIEFLSSIFNEAISATLAQTSGPHKDSVKPSLISHRDIS